MAEGCERCADAIDELALGVAAGQERAMALAHVAGCPGCRERLEQLSVIADGLLLLAPGEEPPVGFESRISARIEVELAARRGSLQTSGRARRRLAGAAALTAVAIALLGVSWIGSRDDVRLAADYRAALTEVNGTSLTTFALRGADSERIGSGFAYEGDPSWVYLTIEAPAGRLEAGDYEAVVSMAGRGSPALSVPLRIAAGRGSGGATFEGEAGDIGAVRLERDGGPTLDLSADPSRAAYP